MFLPENIDLAHSESYDLSIRLTPDGFSFFIHSANDPSIFHFKETSLGSKFSYVENIKRLIFDLGFLSQPFHRTSVTVVSPKYTLVPDAFFESKRVEEIARYNFHQVEGSVHSDHLVSEKYHIVYLITREVHSFLTRSLWSPTFHHQASLLLPLFRSRSSENDGRCCFVDFHDNHVSIACYNNANLLTTNMFPATHPRDTLYGIVSIWEKLAFDRSTDTLILSGNPPHPEIVDELKELFPKVEQLHLELNTHVNEEQKRSLPTDILVKLCES